MEELPAFQCVHRGLDVIARQAAFLRYNYTLPPPLIKVISDAIDRDVDTSRSLLQGLRLPDFPVVADVRRSFHAPLLAPFFHTVVVLQCAIFDPAGAGVCPRDAVERPKQFKAPG
jgi:hypothetical protein